MISKSTFGNPEKYKTIDYIVEYIDKLHPFRKRKALKFFANFNKIIIQLENMIIFNKSTNEDERFNIDYFIDLVSKEYIDKVEKVFYLNYDEKIIDYIKNYVISRLRSVRKLRNDLAKIPKYTKVVNNLSFDRKD